MELMLYGMLAGGLILFLAALLLKRPMTGEAGRTAAVPLNRSELEQTLQRFVLKIQSEQQQAVSEWRSREAALQQELADLRERIRLLEAQRVTAVQPDALQQTGMPGDPDMTDADALALRERYRRVFEWQREGLGPEEIAKRLGAGQGEIELILSLASSSTKGGAHG